ncbi:MAG: hypothetical protein ACUZ8E_18010 [Candidatus Anammoxibacter sp.]
MNFDVTFKYRKTSGGYAIDKTVTRDSKITLTTIVLSEYDAEKFAIFVEKNKAQSTEVFCIGFGKRQVTILR